MRIKFFKVSSVLTIAMFLMVIFMGNAFGFGLKDLTGGKKESKVSVDSLVDNQTDLVKRLYAALIDINKAQQHFAKALDDKKMLETLEKQAQSLADPNVKGPTAINEDISVTANVSIDQELLLKGCDKLDESKKQ